LYEELAERHDLSGPSRFSRADLLSQTRLPGMQAVVARARSETGPDNGPHPVVAAKLWLEQDGWMIDHLTAATAEGYRNSAGHGMLAVAVDHFQAAGYRGLWLGGSAGSADTDDGLAQFKRGWANMEAQAWIGGRVGQPARYRQLTAAHGPGTSAASYFPAYRAPLGAD
jgi:hypothetical protein